MDCSPPYSTVHGILQAKILSVCHALPQGIFPTQVLNPCLLHLLHWWVGSLPLVPPGKPTWSIRLFNISGSITKRLPWVIPGANGTSEVGSVVNVFPPMLIYECHHFIRRPMVWYRYSGEWNKASGGDGIPVELFQILKDDAMKVVHSICQQIWQTQQWPQDWKGSFFIPIPKNAWTTAQLHSSHMLVK